MKLKHFIATLILLVVPVTYGTVTAQDAEEISEKQWMPSRSRTWK